MNEFPTPPSNNQEVESGSEFLKAPPQNGNPVEIWAFYNAAEKEAKKAKEVAAVIAMKEVSKTDHKFVKTLFGGAQQIAKETRKPKDTLKFVLQQAGHYDLCRKDDIDLNKVDELVEAGMLDADLVKEHIDTKASTYLQLKK